MTLDSVQYVTNLLRKSGYAVIVHPASVGEGWEAEVWDFGPRFYDDDGTSWLTGATATTIDEAVSEAVSLGWAKVPAARRQK